MEQKTKQKEETPTTTQDDVPEWSDLANDVGIDGSLSNEKVIGLTAGMITLGFLSPFGGMWLPILAITLGTGYIGISSVVEGAAAGLVSATIMSIITLSFFSLIPSAIVGLVAGGLGILGGKLLKDS